MFELPGDHGKTTHISRINPVREICRNKNIAIALIWANIEDAGKMLLSIAKELEFNEELNRDFGPFKPYTAGKTTPWNTQAITVERMSKRKEATITALGTGSKIFGGRYDVVTCDDIINLDNSATEKQREDTEKWFFEGVSNTVRKGKIRVVGTRMHPLDLYGVLEKNKAYHKVIKTAILDKEKKKVLWSNGWTYEALIERMNEIGAIAFRKRYMNQCIDEDLLIFKESWVDSCKNYKRPLGVLPDMTNIDVLIGVDLASGMKAHNDYFVIFVLGYDRVTRRRYILDIFRDRVDVKEHDSKVIVYIDHYVEWLKYVAVESLGYQKKLIANLKEKRPEVKYIEVATSKATKMKIDDRYNEAATSLSVIVENGALDIPWKEGPTRDKMEVFVNELVAYPSGEHDDQITGWLFIEDQLKENRMATVGKRKVSKVASTKTEKTAEIPKELVGVGVAHVRRKKGKFR